MKDKWILTVDRGEIEVCIQDVQQIYQTTHYYWGAHSVISVLSLSAIYVALHNDESLLEMNKNLALVQGDLLKAKLVVSLNKLLSDEVVKEQLGEGWNDIVVEAHSYWEILKAI